MARGVCSPCQPGRAWETTRPKQASALGTAVRRVKNGSSSFSVPAAKDTDMFVVATVWLNGLLAKSPPLVKHERTELFVQALLEGDVTGRYPVS